MSARGDEDDLAIQAGVFLTWTTGGAVLGSTHDPLLSVRINENVVSLLNRFGSASRVADILALYPDDRSRDILEAIAHLRSIGVLGTSLNGKHPTRRPETAYNIASALGDTADIDRVSPEFRSIYDRIRPYTLTSLQMAYALYGAIKYVIEAHVPGDVVECGVGAGGSMLLAAMTLAALGDTHRHMYLFDTFAWDWGDTSDRDGLLERDRAEPSISTQEFQCYVSGAAAGQLPGVRVSAAEVASLITTVGGYPDDKVHAVPEDVTRLPQHQIPAEISVLRLDTDLYDSTRFELDNFYPHLMPGGVLIVDDYAKLQGATMATDDWFGSLKVKPLLNRIGTQGRIGVRPSVAIGSE